MFHAALISLAILSPATDPDAATSGLLSMFESGCQAVALGEYHGVESHAVFRSSLINHPEFHEHVDTIAIEFGSAFHQPLLDRWILEGEDLSIEDVQPIWRDTLQMFVWDGPAYQAFLEEVRAINLTLPREDRVRVLGIAPAVDWQNATSHDDIAPFMERGRLMPQRIADEAMEHGDNVLIIAGEGHYARRFSGGTPGGGSAYLDHRYPGDLCVIITVSGKDGKAEEFAENHHINLEDPALFYPVAGTEMGDMPALPIRGFFGAGTISETADAVLYLGPGHNILWPDFDQIYTDEYLAELRRRVPLLWPQVSPSLVDSTLARHLEKAAEAE